MYRVSPSPAHSNFARKRNCSLKLLPYFLEQKPNKCEIFNEYFSVPVNVCSGPSLQHPLECRSPDAFSTVQSMRAQADSRSHEWQSACVYGTRRVTPVPAVAKDYKLKNPIRTYDKKVDFPTNLAAQRNRSRRMRVGAEAEC